MFFFSKLIILASRTSVRNVTPVKMFLFFDATLFSLLNYFFLHEQRKP